MSSIGGRAHGLLDMVLARFLGSALPSASNSTVSSTSNCITSSSVDSLSSRIRFDDRGGLEVVAGAGAAEVDAPDAGVVVGDTRLDGTVDFADVAAWPVIVKVVAADGGTVGDGASTGAVDGGAGKAFGAPVGGGTDSGVAIDGGAGTGSDTPDGGGAGTGTSAGVGAEAGGAFDNGGAGTNFDINASDGNALEPCESGAPSTASTKKSS